MDLPSTAALVPRLEILEHAGSTNDELAIRAREDGGGWPDRSVVVTDDQRNGRGRLGRVWTTPPGASLAVSILLRPVTPSGRPLGLEAYGWLPLLAGAALASSLQDLGVPAGVKWPNDVLIGGRKVSGILSELLPTGDGAIVGTGINLRQRAGELPTDRSTSLLLEGLADPDPDTVLAGYLRAFGRLYDAYLEASGDAEASGLRTTVTEHCVTLDSSVRVELPGGGTLTGTAERIDPDGRLVVRPSDGGAPVAVAAGDVTHVR
ncbi:biotin--[acetyl-CoA-carboxylase] ligase [Plantibacter sp. ME-Dv--P-095]|uniref:biotin--[acetyl-CoA-carboxylase] ligase n=1 Tax=Plantibacter sp. ME-Dv--P-095 TaxID=3040299 RepID=UPI00254FA3D9|nr:biotin--[acetyl-CoA-carboxylase] ligase [Plantibacter sp. ME-Dv--P-095]